MSERVQSQLITASQVARETSVRQGSNGVCFAVYGEAKVAGADLEQIINTVPAAIADALKRKAYYFVPLAIAEMRGDVATYRMLVPRTENFTLMSPFGGPPSREADITEKTWDGMSRFFRNGTLKQELIQTYAGTDMIVLVTVERANVEVGGLPAQDWALRVTLVYQREGGEWRLAHRHADPLRHAITLQQSAALGRGA